MLILLSYTPISPGHSFEDTTSSPLLQATLNLNYRRTSVRQSNAHCLIGADFHLPFAAHSGGTGGPLQYHFIPRGDHAVLWRIIYWSTMLWGMPTSSATQAWGRLVSLYASLYPQLQTPHFATGQPHSVMRLSTSMIFMGDLKRHENDVFCRVMLKRSRDKSGKEPLDRLVFGKTFCTGCLLLIFKWLESCFIQY